MSVKGYKYAGTKRFYDLRPGDKFKALIHNIRPGEVTIRFATGELYTARSKVLPDARIGEESGFLVKENDYEGRIVLEMMKVDPLTKKTNMLISALENAGLGVTNEMLEIGHAIVDNGIAVDAESLHRAAFFAHALDGNIEPILFLLREGFPAETEFSDAMSLILNEPRILSECLEANSLQSFDPTGGNLSTARYLKEVFEKIYLTNAHKPSELNEKALCLIRFMSRVKSRTYVQVPFASPNHHSVLRSELHLSSKNALSSAAITVDTASLGRIEVFVDKGYGRCQLEVKGSSVAALGVLKRNFSQLSSALSRLGHNATVTKFEPIKMPFTILTPMTRAKSESKPAPERFTFDMRV